MELGEGNTVFSVFQYKLFTSGRKKREKKKSNYWSKRGRAQSQGWIRGIGIGLT